MGFEYANLLLSRTDKHSLVLILKKHGARIGDACDIETGLVFHNCRDYTNLRIGNNCHIGKQCFFDLRGGIHLEDNVVVSMRCNFITHQDLEKSALSASYPAETADIHIGRSCYLGLGASVLKGVTIGEHSIVAAQSLVLSDVPARVVVGGVPARELRRVREAGTAE